MPAVIIFLDRSPMPDNTTEVHVFESDAEAVRFSEASVKRRHTLRRIDAANWHKAQPQPRKPEPAR
jgi:hypothetical protein